MKNYILLGLLSVSIALGYVLQWPATNIVLLALLDLLAWLWNEVPNGNEAWGSTRDDAYSKIVKQIEAGEASEPKHNRPGLNFVLGENKKMFCDFAAFADKLNDLLRWGGWRVQEQTSGIGVRNYSILYNGLKVGHLNLGVWSRSPYKTAETEVSADIEVVCARVFYYDNVRRFLLTIGALIGGDTLSGWDRTREEIDHNLTSYLWDVGASREEMIPLNIRIHGRSLAYFKRCRDREDTSLY